MGTCFTTKRFQKAEFQFNYDFNKICREDIERGEYKIIIIESLYVLKWFLFFVNKSIIL